MFQIIFIQFSYVFDLERNEDKKYHDGIPIIAFIIILTQKLDPHDALKGFRNMIYSLNGRCMMNAEIYEKLILLPLKYLYMEIRMNIIGLNFVLLLECVGS